MIHNHTMKLSPTSETHIDIIQSHRGLKWQKNANPNNGHDKSLFQKPGKHDFVTHDVLRSMFSFGYFPGV